MSDLPSSADTYRRLTGVDPTVSGKRIGSEYAVPCINRAAHNHGDKNPSLHINTQGKGWTCRVCGVGGGSLEMVKFAGNAKTDAEALEWLGVEKEQPRRVERRIVATYAYRNADGVTLYEALRYEPKGFAQRRKDSSGRDVWNLEGVTRVPYRLPELLDGIGSRHTVVVVEGEKDADNLAKLGFVVTTNAGGAGWQWTADFVKSFTGAKRIIVIADNDDAGRTAARTRAQLLRDVCGDVRLIEFLPTEPKGDVSDLIAQGWTKDRLREMFEGAQVVRGEVERLADVVLRQKLAPPPPPALSTGFRCIDTTLGGLRRGQTTVFGARPGAGKSAFGEQLAAHVGSYARVLYMALELGTDRSTDRMVSRMLCMSETEYLKRLRPIDPDKLRELDVHFSEYNTFADIARATIQTKPDMVIIDHSRELDGWFRVEKGSRADISAAVLMGQIVQLGKSSGAHMVVLSQCSRSADNKRPELSSLRDSGAVEEKADNVFFIHRPFQYDPKEEDNNAELICWKSRSYSAFIGHLRWLGETMLFDDPMEQDEWIYSRCCTDVHKSKKVSKDVA